MLIEKTTSPPTSVIAFYKRKPIKHMTFKDQRNRLKAFKNFFFCDTNIFSRFSAVCFPTQNDFNHQRAILYLYNVGKIKGNRFHSLSIAS